MQLAYMEHFWEKLFTFLDEETLYLGTLMQVFSSPIDNSWLVL